MNINIASIQSKLETYAKTQPGKAKIASTLQQMQEDGLEQTAGGSLIISKKMMNEIADELITTVQKSANNAGFATSAQSVLDHFDHITKSDLIKEKDGGYRYELTFEGKSDGENSSLARKSLDDGDFHAEQDYLQNIVALFNNGYRDGHPTNYKYGWWFDHKPTTLDVAYRTGGYDSNDAWVRSKIDRPALQFMQRAVEDFNAKYETKYGIKAVLSAEYTDPNYYN